MALDNSCISTVTVENFREETALGPALQKLSHLIVNGWPTAKTGLDPLVLPCFTFKDQLTVANSIVYKGQQVFIQSTMKSAKLEKIHRTNF